MNLNELIARTRVLIGYLGEGNQFNWWDSSFYTPSSIAYLSPIYPRTVFLAQYNGVCEASRKIHDEHIGVGRSYHLYRLPDTIERQVFKCIQQKKIESTLSMMVQDTKSAMNALNDLLEETDNFDKTYRNEGPINVGYYSHKSLEKDLLKMIAHYLDALKNDYKCYPYLRES